MYCFGTFADVECLMLTIVAYELYVAICNPLLYTVVMSRRFCAQLVVFVSLEALIYPAVFTYFTIQLSFCNSSVINHFFCNFLPTLALFSSDTTINEMVMFPYSSCVPGCSTIIVFLSYSHIITTILRMNSAKQRCTAFSTCASKLATVATFFGALLLINIKSSSLLYGHRQNGLCLPHSFHPSAKFTDLQFKKQDVKTALKRAIGTKLCFYPKWFI